MAIVPAKIAFQDAWQQDIKGVKMMQATTNRSGIALLGRDGFLTLLDHNGKELWKTNVGADVKSISLADTMETFAINESGQSIFVGIRGEIIWKKKVVPALLGIISASGQYVALVTKEPTVILADKFSRPKWVYRNLLKIPTTIGISGNGETVALSCVDERGEGIGAIANNGKPYDAFLGLDPIQDIVVNETGDVVVALDKARCIYCINCVKSFGIWKGKLNSDFIGLSYAEVSKQTLLYSKDGLITILNDTGSPIWEHRFPFPLITAKLTSDGQAIIYAGSEGRVGCLLSRSGRDTSRLEFVEVHAAPEMKETTSTFKKIWQLDLPKSAPGDFPKVHKWVGQDQVEYLLTWSGRERLFCVNDLGEEIWEHRLLKTSVTGMTVSTRADTAILTTTGSVIGFKLDGSEAFKFFGNFRSPHIFSSGSFILLDENGKIRFYRNANHFSHIIEENEGYDSICGNEDAAFVIGKCKIVSIDSDGKTVGAKSFSENLGFCGLDPFQGDLLTGTSKGNIHFLSSNCEEIYRHHQSSPIGLICMNKSEDVVYLGVEAKNEVVIIQNRTNKLAKASLNGVLSCCVSHGKGAVFGTSVDELGLIGFDGDILARYNFPDKLLQLVYSRQQEFIYILSEGGLGKFTIDEGSARTKNRAGYLEI